MTPSRRNFLQASTAAAALAAAAQAQAEPQRPVSANDKIRFQVPCN